MGVDPSVKAKLAAMKGSFNQAKANPIATTDTNYPTYSDGKYKFALGEANIDFSKNSGRLQIDWVFTFMEGEYQGKQKHNYDGLDDPGRLPYVLRNIRKFGIDVNQLNADEIPDVLEAIIKSKPIVYATLKTKAGSDFQNLYIDSVESALTDGGGYTDAPAGANAPSGDKPSGSAQSAATPDPTASADSASASATSGSSPDAGVSGIGIGDRVNFDLEGEKRVGLVSRIEGIDFYVKSRGVEYKMMEEDMVKVA